MPPKDTIRVVVFQEGPWWVGQCLEYDIAAQAKTLTDLYYEMERVFIGHLVVAKERGVTAFEGLREAPHRYWQMFEQASITLQREQLPFRVPPDLLGRIPLPEVKLAETVPA